MSTTEVTTTTSSTTPSSLQALCDAAKRGEHELIEKLIEENKNKSNDLFLDSIGENGSAALHLAAEGGHGRCIATLLRHGASPTIKDSKGRIPLHCAASAGHLKTVKRLLRKTKHIDRRDHRKQTPLHLAIIYGHLPICTVLLETGAGLDKQDSIGATALHLAAMHGRVEILKLILASDTGKETINTVDMDGRTPLHYAVIVGDTDTHAACAKLLLDAGATHAVDSKGNLPIHLAAQCGHIHCVTALLEHNSPYATGNNDGATPLHLAASHVMGSKCVKALLAKGCDINCKDETSRTPLHYAAQHGSAKCTKALLRASAASSPQDIYHRTPVYYAIEGGFAPVCALFSVVGADITLRYLQAPVVQEEADIYPLLDRFGFLPDSTTSQKWNLRFAYYDTLQRGQVFTERERQKKWVQMLSLIKQSEFPKKLRPRTYKGIPDSVRGLAWKKIVQSERAGQLPYQALLVRDSEHLKQIDLDVNRTDRNHVMFATRYGLGQKLLFNVLKGYAIYDPEVGYTQGMSGVAALLLMYMSEEEAFWMLVALMNNKKYGLRGLFQPGFPRLYQQYTAHERLFVVMLPALAAHFETQGVQSSMYSTRWFLTLFGGMLPFAVLLRLWDLFVVEGYQVIHRAALALLSIYERDLLAMPFEQIMGFLMNTEWLQLDPDVFVRTLRKIRITNNFRVLIDAL